MKWQAAGFFEKIWAKGLEKAAIGHIDSVKISWENMAMMFYGLLAISFAVCYSSDTIKTGGDHHDGLEQIIRPLE